MMAYIKTYHTLYLETERRAFAIKTVAVDMQFYHKVCLLY